MIVDFSEMIVHFQSRSYTLSKDHIISFRILYLSKIVFLTRSHKLCGIIRSRSETDKNAPPSSPVIRLKKAVSFHCMKTSFNCHFYHFFTFLEITFLKIFFLKNRFFDWSFSDYVWMSDQKRKVSSFWCLINLGAHSF